MIREGYIEKIIYRSDETGYTVFSVETTEGEETFVGTVGPISEGIYLTAEGEYVHHPQYDLQFRVDSYELTGFHIQVYAVDRTESTCGIAFVVSLYIIVYQFRYFDHRSLSFIPAEPGS